MITQKKSLTEMVSYRTKNKELSELLSKEWLLTNKRGCFSSSSMAGCNTRRYHSLLMGSLNPPANRIIAVPCCHETIITDDKKIEISNIEFTGAISGEGNKYLRYVRKDVGVHFDYKFKFADLTKSIYLLPEMDAIALVYSFSDVYSKFDFTVRPFTAMRDFHSLIHNTDDTSFSMAHLPDGLVIKTQNNDEIELFMKSDQMWFEDSRQWWHNFYYRKEKERMQDCCEHLWSPGEFKQQIEGNCELILWMSIGDSKLKNEIAETDLDVVISDLNLRKKEVVKNANPKDEVQKMLFYAADEFVIDRTVANLSTKTILAGYPWFLDWGRDTFISLQGLLLDTEQYATAFEVLNTFAHAVSEGMIPNRFDDYGNMPHYNSMDASLWFCIAAFEYLKASKNIELFRNNLLPAILAVEKAYQVGTRFGIHADDDGLIMGGSQKTQLTWMDAKAGDTAFTPRYGKAVEINALWYNVLCFLEDYFTHQSPNDEMAAKFSVMAQKVQFSFVNKFWDENCGYLCDNILPDKTKDCSLRPNQIFAVSLPYSPISIKLQKQIVNVVQEQLLTPYGLRSLSPADPRFRAKYEGSQYERDSAYHQGTVWAYLIGPFIEAYLKVNEYSMNSRRFAAELIGPLLDHLKNDGCIGSVSEIFDASEPFAPKGCFAQAWSVAGLLHSYKLIYGPNKQQTVSVPFFI